jgi:hypothetical protein
MLLNARFSFMLPRTTCQFENSQVFCFFNFHSLTGLSRHYSHGWNRKIFEMVYLGNKLVLRLTNKYFGPPASKSVCRWHRIIVEFAEVEWSVREITWSCVQNSAMAFFFKNITIVVVHATIYSNEYSLHGWVINLELILIRNYRYIDQSWTMNLSRMKRTRMRQ